MAELLSPAGNMQSAIAAINAGADAIYVGGKNFSARNLAENFTDDELERLINHAAVHGVKIYIAVNTLYKNAEIPLVVDFVRTMHAAGAAAFILQDIGLAHILRNHLPDIEIHASTQMTIHSTNGAKYMENMGFTRVVLARELSLAEITEIKSSTNIELETFIHGALCYAYSGQCLMSSLIGGRSGNRGKCAQICRTKFDLQRDGETVKAGYLLSPKDINTLDILGDILSAGATCFKIEGRMKSPEYVYLVTSAYRQALDGASVNSIAQQKLLQIFNRGGSFSQGYYNSFASPDMMSTITPKSSGARAGTVISAQKGSCTIKFAAPMLPGDGIEIWTVDGNHVGTGISKEIAANSSAHFVIQGNIAPGNPVYKSFDKALADNTKREMTVAARKRKVLCEVEALAGKQFCLSLSLGGLDVTVYGNAVQQAKNAPVSRGEILAQLAKTGSTPFELEFTKTNIDENIFVGKAELNQMRRSSLEQLENEILRNTKRPVAELNLICPSANSAQAAQQKLTLQISDLAHLPMATTPDIARVYLPLSKDVLKLPEQNTEIFLTLPQICRNEAEKELAVLLPNFEESNIDGYLVSTYGQLMMLKSMQTTKQIMLNYTFNIVNNHAIAAFNNQDLAVTLSQELNINEISDMTDRDFELVAYGRQILMSTHNCPIGLYDTKGKAGKFCSSRHLSKDYTLRDKIGVNFPILTDCNHCTAHILNSKILDTAPKFAAIKSTGASSFRLIFTTEDAAAVSKIIDRYINVLNDRPYLQGQVQTTDVTYGHYFRGVE